MQTTSSVPPLTHRSLNELPALLTRGEFAEYVRESQRTVDRRIQRGTIRAIRHGAKVVITRDELRRYLEGGE